MAHEPIKTDGHGDILYVDFIDGKPHAVLTTKTGYDFEYCRRDDEILFHDSGGGIRPGKIHDITEWCDYNGKSFWAADCVKLRIRKDWDHAVKAYRVDEDATPEALAKHGLVRLYNIDNPFGDATEAYYGIEYCSICDDHFDHDSTCNHVWWGNDGTTGPGSDDGINDLKDTFLRFCAIAGITRRLPAGLVPFDIGTTQRHAVGGLGPSFVHLHVRGKWLGDIARKFDNQRDDDELSDAAQLLFAIDEKTTKTNALIKQWLHEAIDAQDKRRASYERSYVVADDYRYAADEECHADPWRKYIDGYDSGSVFATKNQKHAARMSWREASKLAKQLNKISGRREFVVRYVRPRNVHNAA